MLNADISWTDLYDQGTGDKSRAGGGWGEHSKRGGIILATGIMFAFLVYTQVRYGHDQETEML